MNIQLKQAEIVEALKQYITKQGINLNGKEVSIAFTAGRKETGLTADLVIDDVAIPGFTDADEMEENPEKPTGLTVVPPAKKTADEPAAEVKEPATPVPQEDGPTAAKPSSLFS